MPGPRGTTNDSTETRRQKHQLLTELQSLGVEINTGIAHKMYLSDIRVLLQAVREASKRP